MDNTTLFCADKTTHVKIVVMALIASTVVGIVGISARMAPGTPAPMHAAPMHNHAGQATKTAG